MPDEELHRALDKLLGASKDFTLAYTAWTHAPRPFEAKRRDELTRAEERLTRAQADVASLQRKGG